MVAPGKETRRTGAIWVMDLDTTIPEVRPDLPAIFHRLGPDAALRLAAAPGASAAAEINRRFASGRRCYAAFVGEELAAYGWVSFDSEYVGELDLSLQLLPGEAYIWNCVTLPAYRRNHLYSALLVYIAGELRADSLCRAWIGADLDNLPSQRGIARAGFRGVAELWATGDRDKRLTWVQGLPGVPESLVVEARRVYLGDRDQVRLAAFAPK